MSVCLGACIYLVFKQLSIGVEILGEQNVIGLGLLWVPRFILFLVGNKDRLWRNQRTLVNTFVGIWGIIHGVSGADLDFVERKYVYS